MFYKFLFIVWYCSSTVSASCEECDPVQYLEYGTTSTLECSFGVDFYSVLWYGSEDYITAKPIVTLQEGRVIHNDRNSYEYDITVDGSLVINYVNLSHEHQFLAIKFDRNGADPSYHYIHAIVSGKKTITCSRKNKIKS